MSDFYIPKLISHRRNCLNGNVVNANMWVALRDATNHIESRRHRQVYGRAWSGTAGKSGTTEFARFRFRAGIGATKLAVNVTTLLCEIGAASPYVELDLTISGGATTTSDPIPCAITPTGVTPTDGPDEQSVGEVYLSITPGTVYECVLRGEDYARIAGVCVYELADPITAYNTHQPTGGSPILDSDRQRIVEGLSNLYKANGAINFHWGRETGTARTRTSNVPINLIDGSTTGDPTAGASPGFFVDPRWHRTASRTVVPMELAVYASIAGGGGTVRLRDPSGNTFGSVSVTSATPQWLVTPFDLTESSERFLAPQFYSDGVNLLSVFAISVIEYDP